MIEDEIFDDELFFKNHIHLIKITQVLKILFCCYAYLGF